MTFYKSILIIILARGNSIRVKNKNIREIKGKSLISITLNFAKKLKNFKIVLSTDSERIKKISNNFDKIIIHNRTKKYSGPKSQSLVLVAKIIKWYNDKYKKNIKGVILLQPTSPFRKKSVIISTVNKFVKNNYRYNYISVTKCNKKRTFMINKKNHLLSLSSQALNGNCKANGNFYIFNIKKIKKSVNETIKNFQTKGIFINSTKYSTDIDSDEDLKKARSFEK